jgi:hypothetical protein
VVFGAPGRLREDRLANEIVVLGDLPIEFRHHRLIVRNPEALQPRTYLRKHNRRLREISVHLRARRLESPRLFKARRIRCVATVANGVVPGSRPAYLRSRSSALRRRSSGSRSVNNALIPEDTWLAGSTYGSS